MSRHHTFIAALTCFGLIHAPKIHAQPLATDFEDQTASPTLSQKEFAEKATGNIGFLRLMRDWRDTLRGNGAAPRRDLLSSKILGHDAKIALGAVAPPQTSGLNGAGISASLGVFEIGTTARPDALNGLLKGFDRTMTGEKIGDADGQSVSWLRARPISGENAELEISLARAARDLQSGEGENWKNGEFESFAGRLNIPARWKATAKFAPAQMEDSDAKIEWKTRLEGPIKHPFGEARASASWSATDSGFENFASQNGQGTRVGVAEAAQDLKIGALSGTINARGEKIARDDAQNARIGEEIEKSGFATGAQLKLGLFAGLALQAQGQWQIAQSEKLGAVAASDAAPTVENSNFLDQSQTRGGEVGLSWQLSRATTLGATLGRTHFSQARATEEAWQDLPGNAENRGEIKMRHQTGEGVFAASFSSRERDNNSNEDWQRLAILGIEAERRLIGSFRLRARADFARDRDASWKDQSGLARRFETGLIFSRASRLDLRWRDGAALPGQLLGDPLGAPFGSLNQSGAQEIAARFNAGSAAGSNGFGLALEYALQRHLDERNGSWKIGLSYR